MLTDINNATANELKARRRAEKATAKAEAKADPRFLRTVEADPRFRTIEYEEEEGLGEVDAA